MGMSEEKETELETIAKNLRKRILKMIYTAKASHIASSFSILDILLYLYEAVLKIDPAHPDDPARDSFILSKGWAAAGLYSVLVHKGFFPEDLLDTYCQDGSRFIGITTMSGIPGIEATTGSMGHGLPISVGFALAARMQKSPHRIFTIISDGELDEGSTLEAIFFAGFHKLSHLTLIVDYNKYQSFGRVKDVLDPEPLADKFKAFRWSVREVDGHNFKDMARVFAEIPAEEGKPTAIIAHTIKGKGISFMEDKNEWHYRYPNREQYESALKELS